MTADYQPAGELSAGGDGQTAPILRPTTHQVTFDPENLLDLLDGDREKMRELVADFLGDLPTQIHAMRESLEKGDASELAGAAHFIKGSSGSLGFTAISETAARLESSGNEGSIEGARELIEILERENEAASRMEL